MINEKAKSWIDKASYEVLFSKWRLAPTGDPLLQGETGKYYSEVMAKRQKEISYNEQVRISKHIGWNK